MDAGGGAEAAANGGIEGSADPCSSAAAGGHRLSVHQIAGGGKGPLFFPQLPVPHPAGLRSASCCYGRAISSVELDIDVDTVSPFWIRSSVVFVLNGVGFTPANLRNGVIQAILGFLFAAAG